MKDLSDLVQDWPEPDAAALAVLTPEGLVGAAGNTSSVSRIASISKLFTAIAALIAIEEETLDLDESAGRPGATVRHLLSHTAGFALDRPILAADVGLKRIYSNVGIEVLAEHLSIRAEMDFASYLDEAIFSPLGMSDTLLTGSPAFGVGSTVDDLALFARELMSPTLISPETLWMATQPHFPGLGGVLPGWGRYDPLAWGLGFEVKGDKSPHWSGTATSELAYGHFGATGTYLWVDPDHELAAIAISGTAFGDWAKTAWPETNDAIIDLFA